jgi:hypothetical protein
MAATRELPPQLVAATANLPDKTLIASACVIAQLELLKNAAKLIGWSIDEPKISDLLNRI